MCVSKGFNPWEASGQTLPGREAGQGLPGTGENGIDIEILRLHDVFREQATDQLRQVAGS